MALRTLRASIRIRADIDAVFAALTSPEQYPLWNRFTPRVDAPNGIVEGQRMTLHITYPNGKRGRAREHITEVSPPHNGRARFAYAYRGRAHPLFVRGSRVWELEAEGELTRVISTERLEGPFARFAPWEQICQGIEASLDELKAHLEG